MLLLIFFIQLSISIIWDYQTRCIANSRFILNILDLEKTNKLNLFIRFHNFNESINLNEQVIFEIYDLHNKEFLSFRIKNSYNLTIIFSLKNYFINTTIHSLQIQPLEWIHIEFDWLGQIIKIQSILIHIQFNFQNFGYQFRNEIELVQIQNQICLLKSKNQWFFLSKQEFNSNPYSSLSNFQYRQLDIKGFKFQLWIFNNEPSKNILSVYGSDQKAVFKVSIENELKFIQIDQEKSNILDTTNERQQWFNIFYCSLYQDEFHQSIFIQVTYHNRVFVFQNKLKMYVSFDQSISFKHNVNNYQKFIIEQYSIDNNQLYSIQWDQLNDNNQNKDQLHNIQNEFNTNVRSEFTCLFSYVLVNNNCVKCPQLEDQICLNCIIMNKEWINKFQCDYEIKNHFFAYIYLLQYFLDSNYQFQIDKKKIYKKQQLNYQKKLEKKQSNDSFWQLENNIILGFISKDFILKPITIQFIPCNDKQYRKISQFKHSNKHLYLIQPYYYIHYELQIIMYQLFEQIVFEYQNINYQSIQDLIKELNYNELLFVEKFTIRIQNEDISQMSARQLDNIFMINFWSPRIEIFIIFSANNLKVFTFDDQIKFRQNIQSLEIINITLSITIVKVLLVEVKCRQLKLLNVKIQGQISFNIYSFILVVRNLSYISQNKQTYDLFNLIQINQERYVTFVNFQINQIDLDLVSIVNILDQGFFQFKQINIFNSIFLSSKFLMLSNKLSQLQISDIYFENIYLDQFSFIFYSESNQFSLFNVTVSQCEFQRSYFVEFRNIFANNILFTNLKCFQKKNSNVDIQALQLISCFISNSKFIELEYGQYSVISTSDIFIHDIQYYQQDQNCLFEIKAVDIQLSNVFFNHSTLYGCIFSIQSSYINLKQIYLMQINKEIQHETLLLVPFIIIDKFKVLYLEDFYVSEMSVYFNTLFQFNEDIIQSNIQIVDLSLLNLFLQAGIENQNQIQLLFNIKQIQFSILEFFDIKLTFTQENIDHSSQEQQRSIFNINSQGYINFYHIMINIDSCTQSLGVIFNIQSLEFAIISLKFSVLNCQSQKSNLYNIQSNQIRIISNNIINFIKTTQYLGLFKQFTKLVIQDFKLLQMVPQLCQQLFVIQLTRKQDNIEIQFQNINIIRHYVLKNLISIEGLQISIIKLVNIKLYQCQSTGRGLISIQIQNAIFLLLVNIIILNGTNIDATKCSFINAINVQKVKFRNLRIWNSKCSQIQIEGSKMLDFNGISITNSFFNQSLIKIISQNKSIILWKQVSLINNSQVIKDDSIIIIQGQRIYLQNFLLFDMQSTIIHPLIKFNSYLIKLEQFIFANNKCQNICLQFSPYSDVKFITSMIIKNYANIIVNSSFSKFQVNHTTFNNYLFTQESISINLEQNSILSMQDSNIVNDHGNNYFCDKFSSNFSFMYQYEGQIYIKDNNQNLSLIINNYKFKLNHNVKHIYLPSGIDLETYKRFKLESLTYSQYIYEFILLSKYAQNFVLKSESIYLEVIMNQSAEAGINQKLLKFIMDPYINQVGVILIQGIENQTEKFQFSVKTFPCQMGEIQIDRQCFQCIGPTIYSVGVKSQKCKVIDEEKIAESNLGLLNLKDKYWRPSLRNDYIVDCPQCIGGWNVGNKLCKQPFIGAACSECDLYNVQGGGNFSKDQNQNCIQCGQNYQFWIYLFLLMCWQLITLMISVKSHVKVSSNYQILKLQTKFYEILNKLQVDQLQVLTKQMQLYFQVFKYMYQNNISNIILIVSNPIQIISQQTLCYGLYFQTNYSYLYILILFSNILINLSFYFILFTIAVQLRILKYKASFIYTPIFILLNFKAIILFDYISKLLTSVKISNISWVQANLSLWYFDEQHQKHLIWISIALMLYLYLFKNKSFLLNCHFYSVYGSIYKEYNRSKYYWEFIRLIYKIILVFLTRISFIYNRISTLIILTLTYLGLINSQQPFLLQNLNQWEESIFKMFILTFTMAILLIANQNVVYLIYIINIIYIAGILKLMIKIYSQNNIKQIDYIKIKLVSCMPYLKRLKVFKLLHPLQINARQQFRRIKTNFKIINNRQRPKLSLNIEPIAYPSENSSYSQVQRLETQSKQIEMQQFDL